jgi:hypothetical protein
LLSAGGDSRLLVAWMLIRYVDISDLTSLPCRERGVSALRRNHGVLVVTLFVRCVLRPFHAPVIFWLRRREGCGQLLAWWLCVSVVGVCREIAHAGAEVRTRPMPDAYVERLSAILLQHKDACKRPPGVPALVWGSLRDPGLSSAAWNNIPRLTRIKTALSGGRLSAHDRIALQSDVFTPLKIRRNCVDLKDLYFFQCFDASVDACIRRRENPKLFTQPGLTEKSGPYSGLVTLWRNWDTRSHLILFMDFFAHFCREPYCPNTFMRSFGRAYNEYRALTADEPMHVSAEAAWIFFHCVLDGKAMCRFEDDCEQFGYRLVNGDEKSAQAGSSSASGKLKGPRFRARKNAREGVIRPAKRAFYRLRFLLRLGYRFAPVEDHHRRND